MKYLFIAVLTSVWLVPSIAAFIAWRRGTYVYDAVMAALACVFTVIALIMLIGLTVGIAIL